MSFVMDSDDDELIIDLKNMLPKPKKVNDSLPMPEQEDNSIVIGSDIELGDVSELDLESLVLGSSIATEDDEQDSINEDSILKANSIHDDDEVDVNSNIFEDSLLTGSAISNNISDEGISLEGGLQLRENGEIDTWSVDLGVDYATPDSGTALLPNDVFDLEDDKAESSDPSEEIPIGESFDNHVLNDSIIDDWDVPVLKQDLPILTQNNVELDEWPIWVVLLIVFTSGMTLLTALTTLDLLICDACSTPNCHTPLIIQLARDLGWNS
jgi:hypothetical protein